MLLDVSHFFGKSIFVELVFHLQQRTMINFRALYFPSKSSLHYVQYYLVSVVDCAIFYLVSNIVPNDVHFVVWSLFSTAILDEKFGE